MKVEGRWRRSIERADDGGAVVVLDQARLPYAIAWLRIDDLAGAARAIRDMHVRGAPLIGATAAYGVALAMRADATDAALAAACATLAATRPTAINLRWALDRMRGALAPVAVGARAAAALVAAAQICDEDVAQCEAIGRHGLALMRGGGASPGAAGAGAHPLQRRLAGHGRLGHRAGADLHGPRGRRAGPGVGRRDPAAQPGRQPDRLGAGAGTACRTR
jgi:hypothetical protein